MEQERKIIDAVRNAISNGDKVLIVPVKDGVRLFRFERREIKLDYRNITHERKR